MLPVMKKILTKGVVPLNVHKQWHNSQAHAPRPETLPNIAMFTERYKAIIETKALKQREFSTKPGEFLPRFNLITEGKNPIKFAPIKPKDRERLAVLLDGPHCGVY